MKEITLTEYSKLSAKRAKEWQGDQEMTLSFRGTELAGEVGEALNIIKKMERKRLGLVSSEPSIEDLAEELADIIMCTDLIASDLGINLNDALINKFNKTSDKYKLKTKIE